jgi:hypothetical protein
MQNKTADWKRELIPDHKFDFVDVKGFRDESIFRKTAYLGVFLLALKAVLVYVTDFGAVLLVLSTSGLRQSLSGNAQTIVASNEQFIFIPSDSNLFGIDPNWKIALICCSVLMSFLLLAIEWRKAKKIIRSRDISYAFTSVPAYRYYAIKSYSHYCFCTSLLII